jgi:hypothetical protein
LLTGCAAVQIAAMPSAIATVAMIRMLRGSLDAGSCN